MAKTITLKFPAKCADLNCGKDLPAGTRAKWYGRGRVYGMECHQRTPALPCETCGGLPCLEGCAKPPREPMLRDPGEDAADRWNETHG